MPVPTWSVVVPVYRSEASLRALYGRLVVTLDSLGAPYELIFVDDCGSDQTWAILTELALADARVVAMQMMRNCGQVAATMAGLHRAAGQVVITLDDDLQHPPEEIPALLHALAADPDVDVVIGAPSRTRHPVVRRLGSRAVNYVGSWLLGKDPALRFTGFRAIRRPVMEGLRAMRAPFPALGPMLFSITRRIVNVTVRHDARAFGQSGYTLRRLLRHTVDNFVGYSVRPLRWLAALGAAGALGGALMGGALLIRSVASGVFVPAWQAVLLVVVVLAGLQLLAIGVIGEYLLRIMQSTMTAPPTLIRRVVTAHDAD